MAKAPRTSKTSKTSQKAAGKTEASTVRRAEVEIVDDPVVEAEADAQPPILDGELDFPLTPIDVDPDREVELPVSSPRLVNAEVVSSDSKAVATTNDPIATYLAEIRKYPLLTREQEQELARRYRETGDPKAAEMLVTSNLRFVVKVAAEYSRFGAKLIDLVQEGNVGLMHAVREFNPYKGVRLITYAVWWILGYIQEYLMRQYSLVRIGTTQNQRKLFYRLQKERDLLSASGQEPTVALLAGRLGVTEEEVETMTKRLSGRDLSLNQPLDQENPGASLLDRESATDQPIDESIGEQEEMMVLRENIEKLRPGLSEKEIYLLEKRVLSDEPLTLQEIGDHYGVTREAVRQLEARLILKIKKAFTESLQEGLGDGD